MQGILDEALWVNDARDALAMRTVDSADQYRSTPYSDAVSVASWKLARKFLPLHAVTTPFGNTQRRSGL